MMNKLLQRHLTLHFMVIRLLNWVNADKAVRQVAAFFGLLVCMMRVLGILLAYVVRYEFV